MEFMESFEMHEQQVENLVDHSWQIERQFNCTGIDDSEECMQMHNRAACEWIQNNSRHWEYFLPAHKHCQPGEHVDTTIETFTARCVACQPGFYMDRPSNLHICKSCPAGKFQGLAGQERCEECHIGRYNGATEATSVSNCTDCGAGKHQPSSGSSKCIECGIGEYQNSTGMPFCNPCNTGEYQPENASVECMKCPSNEVACSVEINPEGEVQEKCLDKQATVSSCTCGKYTINPHYRSISRISLTDCLRLQTRAPSVACRIHASRTPARAQI